MFENTVKPKKITEFVDEYIEGWETFYVGAYVVSTGQWITVNSQIFDSKSSLWGPGQPSGDGWCADMLFGEKWDPKWKGKGWRLNDESCYLTTGFICQKLKNPYGKDCGG